MPKIRKKQSGDINKSGILTQNFRKELKSDGHLNNFVLRDVFHNEDIINLDNRIGKIEFNDEDTIIFNNKTVNATLGIEKSYIEGNYEENNKLVNTPNLLNHDDTFNVQKIVNPEDYKHVIYSNYINELESDNFKAFNDEFIDYETSFANFKSELVDKITDYEKIIYNFKRKRYEIKKNFEEINVSNFKKNILNLSFNLNNDSPGFNSSTDNGRNIPLVKNQEGNYFLALNNNTVYLDNNSVNDPNTYYSLGNCKFNYFSSTNNFTNAAITNNPLTLYTGDRIGNASSDVKSFIDGTSISNPIKNFGFPFSKRFRGNSEVEVDISKHINEDFVLEKVYVEFKLKNFAFSTDADKPVFNTLNFFILNQRGNIDGSNKHFKNLYYGNNQAIQESYHWDQSTNSLEDFKVTMDCDESTTPDYFITRTNFATPELVLGKHIDPIDGKVYLSTVTGLNSDDVYSHEEINFTNSKHRELITNIKIANVGHFIEDDIKIKNFKYFMSLQDFDQVIYSDTISSSQLNNLGVPIKDYLINNDWKDVKILSPVKSFKTNLNLKRFSQFEVYPDQRSKRAGLSINSEKSKNSEDGVSFDRATFDDERGQDFDYGSKYASTRLESNFHDNPYILSPKDKLIFGFNFCPSMILNDVDLGVLIIDNKNEYLEYSGRDVVQLDLRNLKIKLLGRYVSNDVSFTPKKSEFENKNIKKINEFSTNVVDKTGLPPQFMMKGAYYNCFTSSSLYYPRFISYGTGSFGGFVNIPQVSSGSISYGLSQMNQEMYVTGSSEISSNIVSYLRDDKRHKDSEFYLNYKFKVDHFGFLSDKINNSKHYAYLDTKTKKTTYNIEKFFKIDGLFLQKDESAGNVINSYNKDKNAALTDVKFIDTSSTS